MLFTPSALAVGIAASYGDRCNRTLENRPDLSEFLHFGVAALLQNANRQTWHGTPPIFNLKST